jgi:hypothetical protein
MHSQTHIKFLLNCVTESIQVTEDRLRVAWSALSYINKNHLPESCLCGLVTGELWTLFVFVAGAALPTVLYWATAERWEVFRIGQRCRRGRHRQSCWLHGLSLDWPVTLQGLQGSRSPYENACDVCGEILKQNVCWHNRMKFPAGYVLSMILRTKGDYFPKQIQPFGLCNGDALSSVWGGNWISKTLFKPRYLLITIGIRNWS